MRNLVFLFGMTVLFLTACSKDDAERDDCSVFEYDFVSIEYGPMEVVPDIKSDPAAEYRNDSNASITVRHSYESKCGISSRFVFESPLKGDLITNNVQVPKVDCAGNLTSEDFPVLLIPDEVYTYNWLVGAVTIGPDIAPGMQYRVVVTYYAYNVTAPFTCSLLNRMSGEIEQVCGYWYATWYYGAESEGTYSAVE